MSNFEQINLTESPENHGQATFDVVKVVHMGLDNRRILELLQKTLQPLGKAMEHVIHPGTGVAVVDMGGKLEIIAIRRITDIKS
jgi:hypothetical protein